MADIIRLRPDEPMHEPPPTPKWMLITLLAMFVGAFIALYVIAFGIRVLQQEVAWWRASHHGLHVNLTAAVSLPANWLITVASAAVIVAILTAASSFSRRRDAE